MSKIVYLDAGHGGADPGALGPSGLKESDMALDVCRKAKALMNPYVDCRLTRDSDDFLTLSERPAIANKGNADVFVSYHFNSASSSSTASSWEIFTTKGQNRSDLLATAIGKEHAKLFPEQRRRDDFSDGDIDKEANFAVLRRTDHPSCLMEGEFIHTSHGEKLIYNPANRYNMALAVARGVLAFLQIPCPELHTSQVESQQPAILTLEERVSRLEALIA